MTAGWHSAEITLVTSAHFQSSLALEVTILGAAWLQKVQHNSQEMLSQLCWGWF